MVSELPTASFAGPLARRPRSDVKSDRLAWARGRRTPAADLATGELLLLRRMHARLPQRLKVRAPCSPLGSLGD